MTHECMDNVYICANVCALNDVWKRVGSEPTLGSHSLWISRRRDKYQRDGRNDFVAGMMRYMVPSMLGELCDLLSFPSFPLTMHATMRGRIQSAIPLPCRFATLIRPH